MKFSIKGKLFLTTISITLFFLTSGVSTFIFLQKIKTSSQLTVPASKLLDNVMRMRCVEKDFLLVEPRNETFFETNKSLYISIFDSLYVNAYKEIETLKKITNSIKTKNEIALIAKKLSRYHNLFGTMTNIFYERGYKSHGAMGKRQSLGRQITKNIKVANIPLLTEFTNNINKLRIEYQILKNKDSYYKMIQIFERYGELAKNDSTLRQQMAIIDDSLGINLRKEINSYQNQITDIYKMDKTLGFSIQEGLHQEINLLASSIEVDIQKTILFFEKTSEKTVQAATVQITTLTLFFILLTMIWLVVLRKSIISPLHKIRAFIKEVSTGKLPEKIIYKNQDEISEMLFAIDLLVKELQRKAHFASEIGKQNYNIELKNILPEDSLGKSLQKMRQNLRNARQEELKSIHKNEIRAWTSQGLAIFSDLLLKDNNNINKFAMLLIKNLVKYLKATQGAIFIVNEENDFNIEMLAAYAYDRPSKQKREFIQKEGILGRCISQREVVYLKEVPKDYLNITSGLGEQTPQILLITPLLLPNSVVGALEIASFTELKPYEIKFVKQLGEMIATTISFVHNGIKTKELLLQTKEQTEELSVQEEEMRQNLEELQSTQEEATRKEEKMRNQIAAYNSATYSVEYDLSGKILKANSIVQQLTKMSSSELIGSNIFDYLKHDELQTIEFKIFWEKVCAGQTLHKITKKTFKNAKLTLSETFTPIYNDAGKVCKILSISFDITEFVVN